MVNLNQLITFGGPVPCRSYNQLIDFYLSTLQASPEGSSGWVEAKVRKCWRLRDPATKYAVKAREVMGG